MIRHAAAFAFACCLTPSWLSAQTIQFTVTTESAQIYNAPSTGSAVIGHVPRGTVFEVTRELGSWVKIAWPAAADGAAYVHVSWGTITHAASPGTSASDARSPRTNAANAPPAVRATAEPTRVSTSRPVSPGPLYVVPPTHLVGLGARLNGSTFGYGATTRAWSRGHLGLQINVSHSAITNSAAFGRVTSTELAPSLLNAFNDRVTDAVWVRPYVGGGPGIYLQTFNPNPSTGAAMSDNSFGVHSFGGAEFTFANMPRLAISADGGYRWLQTRFTGFDFGGPMFSVSAHWYVK
jgi:hypothetical protein